VPEGKTKDNPPTLPTLLKLRRSKKATVVKESKKTKVDKMKNDLCERLFEFAVRVIEFLKTLPYSPEN